VSCLRLRNWARRGGIPGSTHNVKHFGISFVQGCGCVGNVMGSWIEIGVIGLRVFICRRWIYSDKLELTSLLDANRENEIG